ncbi:MAG: 50S ribosomal protein L10 [Selenomonadaceae bacterium]|nr:50S ribosomal protein L10 [Selenomonadaceae bacterium]
MSDKKKAIVAELESELKDAKGAVFTSFKGLTVAMDTDLRRQLRAAGVSYKVVKNTMVRIAADNINLSGIDSHLEGTTAFAFSKDDAVAPAKVICDFIKKNRLEDAGILTVKVGLVEGKVIDANGVKALAALPSKEVLIAKLLGTMQAPIANTVGVLSGILRKPLYVLNAIAEKKSA